MVSWQTIQSLLIFFGPWVLPRLITYYRSIKSRPASQLRPLPQRTSYALAILFLSATVAFVSTFPLFAQENIFRLTSSRLHTSAGVLLTRLAALRPLTPEDEKLREIFDAGGLEARLFYIRYGPSLVRNNPLTLPGSADAARSHLIYALPSLLAPHILHLFALGTATSPSLSGKPGSSWRTLATIAALSLAVAEIYYLANYDSGPNTRSTRLNEIDFVHWKVQVYRGIAVAGLDALLGWVIFLHATGRAFFAPASSSTERILDHAGKLEQLWAKSRGIGVLRNGMVRDAGLRRKVEDYWVREGEFTKDLLEQPEVLEAQRNALKRIDTVKIGRETEVFLNGILLASQTATTSGVDVEVVLE